MQESEVSHESETSSPTFALAAAFQSRQLRNLPNLFVVGAAKSGTTALYEYFRKHPQVFVPNTVKEANFMAFHEGLPPLRGPGDLNAVAKKSITQLDDYLQIFSDRRSEPVAADVSPAYLYFPESAFKIKELCPHAKIVMVLRNPVECAFSMYSMLRRDRREPCRSFSDAFRFSNKRLTDGWQWFWDYPGGWKYSDQVETYLNLFPESQLFIRRYEQLKHRPESFYSELTQFLGIRTIDLTTANRPVNTAPRRWEMLSKHRAGRAVLRLAALAKLFCPPNVAGALRRQFLEPPAFVLNAHDRQLLVEHFADDIRKLASLLGWDLNEWLAV